MWRDEGTCIIPHTVHGMSFLWYSARYALRSGAPGPIDSRVALCQTAVPCWQFDTGAPLFASPTAVTLARPGDHAHSWVDGFILAETGTIIY